MKIKSMYLFLLASLFLATSLNTYAVNSSGSVQPVKVTEVQDDSRLEILEEIMSEVTYKNHKKWMKKKGYNFSESHSSDGISSFQMDYSG